MRKMSLALGVAAVAVTALLLAQPRAGMAASDAHAVPSDTYRQLNLFGEVFERIRSDYVQTPDDRKLVEAAISGMLAGLDPHSSYLDAKSFRDIQVQNRGEFGGIGIEVAMEDGRIKVVKLMEDTIEETPAAKAGILAGDVITAINGEAVKSLTLDQAVDKMRGAINSTIKLQLTRNGRDKPIEVTLARENVRVRSVLAHIEADDIGYIRITSFNEQTTTGLKREIVGQIDPGQGHRPRHRSVAGRAGGPEGKHRHQG